MEHIFLYYTTPSNVFAVIYYVVYHRNARLMTEFMKEQSILVQFRSKFFINLMNIQYHFMPLERNKLGSSP